MAHTRTTHARSMRILIGSALTMIAAFPSAAQTSLDAHRLYEQKCSKCHVEHAGDFGRLKLEIAGDALKVHRSGEPVEKLLGNHRGVKLSAGETAALIELLGDGIRWGGVFQNRCAICHVQAASFARSTLVLKDAALVTKSTGADVRQYLAGHGRATATEIDTLVEMLAYQVRTGPVR